MLYVRLHLRRRWHWTVSVYCKRRSRGNWNKTSCTGEWTPWHSFELRCIESRECRERVNSLLTNSINAACLRPHQHESQPLQPPPSYHEANLLSANRSYKEEITQLRQHNTLLAGQVRALQDHLNRNCAYPPFMTVAQTQNPPTNLSPSQNRQLENYRRAKREKGSVGYTIFVVMIFLFFVQFIIFCQQFHQINVHNKFCDGGKKTKSCSRWSDCTGPLKAGDFSTPPVTFTLVYLVKCT